MKYDLSDIMKKAHSFCKTGKYTWSECLKKVMENGEVFSVGKGE